MGAPQPVENVALSLIAASLRDLALTEKDRERTVSVLSQLWAPFSEGEAESPDPGGLEGFCSSLTPTGFPVEFSFGNPATEVRCVTEVGGRGIPKSGRLELARRRLCSIGAQWDPEQLEWAAGLQAGSALKYGAWAGVRHNDGCERFKLYTEVPLSNHGLAMRSCPVGEDEAAKLTARGARLIMLGLTDRGETEFYFGINGLRYRELAVIFGWFGAQDSAEPVVEAIEAICGRFLNRSGPNRQNGFSARRMADGQWRMSFFAQTHDLFDSGSQTRRALLRAAPEFGCDLAPYEAFSRFAAAEFDSNSHTMLTFTPLRDGSVDLRVGLSLPPPGSLFERN
jgi:hypothetical protein